MRFPFWTSVGALAVLTFISSDFRSVRRWCWPAALAVGVYAAPWVVVSQAGHSEAATPLLGVGDLIGRVAQFFVEYGSVAPLVGSILLATVLWWRSKGRPVLSIEERKFIVACVVLVAEGAPHRVKTLLAQEKKRVSRLVGDTPIYDVIVGNEEGQVPLDVGRGPVRVRSGERDRHRPGRAVRPRTMKWCGACRWRRRGRSPAPPP